MNYTSVVSWACVCVLASDPASLPLSLAVMLSLSSRLHASFRQLTTRPLTQADPALSSFFFFFYLSALHILDLHLKLTSHLLPPPLFSRPSHFNSPHWKPNFSPSSPALEGLIGDSPYPFSMSNRWLVHRSGVSAVIPLPSSRLSA